MNPTPQMRGDRSSQWSDGQDRNSCELQPLHRLSKTCILVYTILSPSNGRLGIATQGSGHHESYAPNARRPLVTVERRSSLKLLRTPTASSPFKDLHFGIHNFESQQWPPRHSNTRQWAS